MTDSEWTIIEAIPGYVSREECEWLMSLASTVQSWTEIGVFHGRSMMAVGLGLRRGGHLYLVDIKILPELLANVEKLKELRPKLHVVVCDKASALAANELPDVDVGFIDGNHSYEFVCVDIITWRRKCEILCGHDYCPEWPGVFEAVNQLCTNVSKPAGNIWIEERQ